MHFICLSSIIITVYHHILVPKISPAEKGRFNLLKFYQLPELPAGVVLMLIRGRKYI
jgi:hypothetical protein